MTGMIESYGLREGEERKTKYHEEDTFSVPESCEI